MLLNNLVWGCSAMLAETVHSAVDTFNQVRPSLPELCTCCKQLSPAPSMRAALTAAQVSEVCDQMAHPVAGG